MVWVWRVVAWCHRRGKDKALVHWWYLPDSYDEYIQRDVAPPRLEPDKKITGPWRVSGGGVAHRDEGGPGAGRGDRRALEGERRRCCAQRWWGGKGRGGAIAGALEGERRGCETILPALATRERAPDVNTVSRQGGHDGGGTPCAFPDCRRPAAGLPQCGAGALTRCDGRRAVTAARVRRCMCVG